jgi:hypothetical protein
MSGDLTHIICGVSVGTGNAGGVGGMRRPGGVGGMASPSPQKSLRYGAGSPGKMSSMSTGSGAHKGPTHPAQEPEATACYIFVVRRTNAVNFLRHFCYGNYFQIGNLGDTSTLRGPVPSVWKKCLSKYSNLMITYLPSEVTQSQNPPSEIIMHVEMTRFTSIIV